MSELSKRNVFFVKKLGEGRFEKACSFFLYITYSYVGEYRGMTSVYDFPSDQWYITQLPCILVEQETVLLTLMEFELIESMLWKEFIVFASKVMQVEPHFGKNITHHMMIYIDVIEQRKLVESNLRLLILSSIV